MSMSRSPLTKKQTWRRTRCGVEKKRMSCPESLQMSIFDVVQCSGRESLLRKSFSLSMHRSPEAQFLFNAIIHTSSDEAESYQTSVANTVIRDAFPPNLSLHNAVSAPLFASLPGANAEDRKDMLTQTPVRKKSYSVGCQSNQPFSEKRS